VVLLLFGPPGSGKGTQSHKITSWLGIPAISTGDMLRAEIHSDTALGKAAAAIMASGGLVGDDLVNRMLAERVSQPDCKRGFLLDGYPRTVEQAEFLDRLVAERRLDKPIILHLDVPLDALVGRLTSRRQCPKCKRIYNLLQQPPKKPGVCDDDGTSLTTRKDDQEDVVTERIRTYDEVTRSVLAHYQDRDYHQIRGDRSPGYIFEEITGILEPLVSKNGAGGDQRAKQANGNRP
jgi:adenylate kinase